MSIEGSISDIVVGSRLQQARSPAESASESELGHDARHSIGWPAFAQAQSHSFANDLSDSDDLESMASSILSGHVPGLTRGSSVASSDCSAMQTEAASALQGGFVLESDDGILTLASSHYEADADLLCPFQILDCGETFSSVREFKTHVFSHFRGHPLPTSACCFLCDDKFEQTTEDDPAMAWNKMLGHMAHDHFRCGQEFGTIRADFNLMRYMYDRKIISDHHFKRSQICPLPTVLPAAGRRASEVASSRASTVVMPEAPSPPTVSSSFSVASEPSPTWHRRSSYGNQPYITFAGPRAERRRRDSTRPIVRQTTTMT